MTEDLGVNMELVYRDVSIQVTQVCQFKEYPAVAFDGLSGTAYRLDVVGKVQRWPVQLDTAERMQEHLSRCGNPLTFSAFGAVLVQDSSTQSCQVQVQRNPSQRSPYPYLVQIHITGQTMTPAQEVLVADEPIIIG